MAYSGKFVVLFLVLYDFSNFFHKYTLNHALEFTEKIM